jgi:hypothetical protein
MEITEKGTFIYAAHPGLLLYLNYRTYNYKERRLLGMQNIKINLIQIGLLMWFRFN